MPIAPAAGAYAVGASTVGSLPVAGEHPLVIVPIVDVTGLDGIVANDRYQVLVVAHAGNESVQPEIRYWLAQAPEWGAVLASGQRSNLVQFFAVDENNQPVEGTLETPYVEVPKGQAASVSHVLVEYVPRPAVLGDFDGGLGPEFPIGFDVYVEGSRIVQFAKVTSEAGRVTGSHVASAGAPRRFRADTGDSIVWPNVMTDVFPVRLTEEIRAVRVSIRNIRLCEIVAIEVYGNAQENRHG